MMSNKTTETDNKIISAVKDYIDENIYRYAVMIDGEWGCGKTYFVKEKLYPELRDHEEKKKISSSKYKPRRIQYISLYGVRALEEITSQIMLDSYFEGKKEGLKKFVDYGKELTSNVLPLVFNIINPITGLSLEHENIKKLSKLFHSTKEKILIFDDLERCDFPVDQILGYINSLVEHCGMKVILIANEKEIGKLSSNQVNNGDSFYGNIKEKLIGVTLQYRPDLKDTLSFFIENMTCSNNIALKTLLRKHLQEFMELMDKESHHNLRTFQFFLSKIVKIYTAIMEGDEDAIKDEIYMNHIMWYCFTACVQIKKNTYNLKWTSEQLCFISSMDSATRKENWAFRFIEIFLERGILDKDMAASTYEHYYVLKYIKTNNLETLSSNWFISDENSVNDNIDIIIEKIESNIYTVEDYPKIIALFIKLENAGFDKTLERMTSAMKKCIEHLQEHVILDEIYDEILEEDIKKKYKEIVAEIQAEIDQSTESPCDLNLFLQKGEGWAKGLYDYVLTNISKIKKKDGFLAKFDIHDLINKLEESSSKDLNDFRSCLLALYVNKAVGEALLSEFPKINALKTEIEGMNKSSFDKIKKVQINYLIGNLSAVNMYPEFKESV